MSVTISTSFRSSTRRSLGLAAVAVAAVFAGILLAMPAMAEESPPRKPTAEELAILRGLLNVKPAVVIPAPSEVKPPSAEASNPAQPASYPTLPAPKTTSSAAAAIEITSENIPSLATSDVSRAVLAARSVTRSRQSRTPSPDNL